MKMPIDLERGMDLLFRYALMLLILSFPVSISGMEIAKIAILLAVIFLAFFRWKKWRASRPFHPLEAVLLAFFLAYLIGIFATTYWGNSRTGTLDHLPVFIPQMVIFLGTYLLIREKEISNLGKYLLILIAVSSGYSLWPYLVTFFRVEADTSISSLLGRSRGFYSHPVMYSKILGCSFSLSLLIGVFSLERYLRLKEEGRPHSGAKRGAFVCLGLLCLLSVDAYFNQSRSLALTMAALPLFALCYVFSQKWKKTIFLLPVAGVLVLLCIPSSLWEKLYRKSSFRLKQKEVMAIKNWQIPEKKIIEVEIDRQPIVGEMQLEGKVFSEFHGKIISGQKLSSDRFRLSLENFERGPVWTLFLSFQLLLADGVTQRQEYLFNINEHFSSPRWDPIYRSSFSPLSLSDFFPLMSSGDFFRSRLNLFEPMRETIYRSTLSMIEKRPWLGLGPGTWKHYIHDISKNDYAYLYSSFKQKHYHGHNNVLTVAMGSGVIAAFFYATFVIGLIILLFFQLLRRRNALYRDREKKANIFWDDLRRLHFTYACLGCFISLNLAGLFDYTVFDGIAGNMHWFLAAVLLRAVKSPGLQTTDAS